MHEKPVTVDADTDPVEILDMGAPQGLVQKEFSDGELREKLSNGPQVF